MTSDLAEQLSKLVAFGEFDLSAEESRGHFMRLVDHHQVPIGLFQLCLHMFVTRELVEACDAQRHVAKGVARCRGFEMVVGEYIKGHLKFATQFVLPLLDEVARGDNQATAQISTNHQFLRQGSIWTNC